MRNKARRLINNDIKKINERIESYYQELDLYTTFHINLELIPEINRKIMVLEEKINELNSKISGDSES